MSPKKKHYENAAKTILKNLEKRQMKGYYCETAKDAAEKILSLMPEGSSIGWGGSVTLAEAGIMDRIREEHYVLYERETAKTKEEQKAMYADIINSDFFLMGTNAVTLDGELINIDGRGSRVAFLCYGPEQVIVVAGMNKVVTDIQAGIKRVHDVAAPMNAVRLKRDTPCAATGRCGNCLSPECLCAQTVITRFSQIPGRIQVILVGEELGY